MSETTTFDDLVLAALKQGGRAATYVVRNRMAMRSAGNYATRRVLAGLRRLEAAGRVRQAPSSYAVMLTWEAAADA